MSEIEDDRSWTKYLFQDEVITAANTAIPTISAIRSVNAVPKLVDIGEDYLIDVSKI